MNLRGKTLLITAITLAALTIIAFFSARVVLHRGFAGVEAEEARKNMIRAVNALRHEVHGLDAKVHDWAAWDDTYAFMVDGNSRYIESNLAPGTFSTLTVNFMIFLDASGKTVFSKGFDLKNGQEIAIPESLANLIGRGSDLARQSDPRGGKAGVVILPEGPLLLASRPIITTEEKGPIRGALVFCRYLDSLEIGKLERITQLSLEIRPWKDREFPDDFRSAMNVSPGEEPVFIRPLDERRIAGYALIRDVCEQPALTIRAIMPRDILVQEHRSMRYLVISILVVGLVFTAVMLFFLENSVLSRLARLNRDFSAIGVRGDFSGRIGEDGRDELTEVAVAGNRMLRVLEESHNEIRRRNHEMRTIMDTVPIGLLSLDREFRISGEHSKSSEKILGADFRSGEDIFTVLEMEGKDRETLREYLELAREESLPEEDLVRLNPFPEISLRKKGTGVRWIKVDWRPMRGGGESERGILMELEDTTFTKALEEQVVQAETARAQILAIAENPDLFREFLAQTSENIMQLRNSALPDNDHQWSSGMLDNLLRQAHTLKGTASAFGCQSLSDTAGEIEERLAEFRRSGGAAADFPGEMARLTADLASDFDTVRRKTAQILGGTFPEDNDILLRVPLREIESMQKTIGFLPEGTGAGLLAELRNQLRTLRMVPAKRGLARAVRIIEDLIRRTGKPVDFRFEGGDILIDCTISRGLNSPLVHLFRNALSHGIESPEERLSLGKPERGLVSMAVKIDRDRFVLEFADDGRGLNPARLREAAIDAGLLSGGEAGELSESDCLRLVFLPGFSTAERVDSLSGRGIGLDAVQEDIRKMNGTIEIDRTSPSGLRFVITVEAENG